MTLTRLKITIFFNCQRKKKYKQTCFNLKLEVGIILILNNFLSCINLIAFLLSIRIFLPYLIKVAKN